VIDGLPTVKRSYWTSSSSFLFYFPTFMYAPNAYTCYVQYEPGSEYALFGHAPVRNNEGFGSHAMTVCPKQNII
jgi:hypothetical protein